jgi:hypothetical protein
LPDIGGRQLGNGDTLIGGALVVALISVFLPWYSATVNCSGIPGCGGSASVTAFNYWTGLLFFLAVLVGLALFIIRTFVPTVTLPTMPQPDAVLFMAIGGFMLLMALLWLLIGSPASYNGPGFSAGVSFGLFIGLIASIGVIAGGFMKKSEPEATRTLPVSSGTTYGGPPSSYGGPPSTPPAPPTA